jgi:hypothetical protein
MSSTRPRHANGLLAMLLMRPFLRRPTPPSPMSPRRDPHGSRRFGSRAGTGHRRVSGRLRRPVDHGARLGQTHGYKRLFLLGVAVSGISSPAGGLSPDAVARRSAPSDRDVGVAGWLTGAEHSAHVSAGGPSLGVVGVASHAIATRRRARMSSAARAPLGTEPASARAGKADAPVGHSAQAGWPTRDGTMLGP